jgi:hypothetical protein
MLEKQGKVVLTDEDLNLYNKGQVSERIKETWGLSFSDLEEVVASHSYTIIKTKEV